MGDEKDDIGVGTVRELNAVKECQEVEQETEGRMLLVGRYAV